MKFILHFNKTLIFIDICYNMLIKYHPTIVNNMNKKKGLNYNDHSMYQVKYMHFLQFTIFLMTLVFITFFTLLLSLFYKFLHIDKKQYILICILSISMLVHKMILKFSIYVCYIHYSY